VTGPQTADGNIASTQAKCSVTGTDPDGKPETMSDRNAEVVCRQADGTWKFVIDNPAAYSISDGGPRNVRAIADQIDEPPRKENVDEWFAPRTGSRATGELDRSSRDWTIGTDGMDPAPLPETAS
jgi:hypothetical protein